MARSTAPDVVGHDDPAASKAVSARPRAEIEAAFEALLATVPDAVDDDGFAIIAGLIEADDWEGLNRDATLPNAEAMVGRRLKVTGITKRPADMGQSMSHYLIADAIDTRTGEVLRWQTSSPGVAVVLVKLHGWGKIPAIIEIAKAPKPTKAGFYPLNTTVLAVG